MKRFTLVLTMAGLGLVGAYFSLSCSSNPTTPGGFQAPLQTVAAVNPSFTPTFTFTATFTFTPTSTGTPTPTPTPYVVTTWSGFNQPSAVAVDASGNVYVADTGNNQVEKYSSSGVLSASWGNGGIKGKISYTSPRGVAVDGAGNLFVVGNGNQVGKYDSYGSPVTSAFSQVSLLGPQGVAVNAAGTTVAVADTGHQQLVELDSGGALITSYPAGVSVYGTAIDASGNVYASTGADNRVFAFSAGVTIPGFSNPMGLSVDAGGNLYVADTGNRQIEEFKAGSGLTQQPLVIFNEGGLLGSPKGVAVDPSSGAIYVADSQNNVIVKFAP